MSGKANIRQKAKFLELMQFNPIERGLNNLPVTKQEMADYIGVHLATIYGWQKEYKEWGEITVPKTEEEEWGEYMAKLYQECMKEGCPANKMQLYASLKGKFVEKQEIKVDISADEIARRNLKAKGELREGGYRVDEVPEESAVLSEKLRLDSGQSATKDS